MKQWQTRQLPEEPPNYIAGQGSQQRLFTYDSLSRLKTAKNPEQVNSSGQMLETSYEYDPASNLLTGTFVDAGGGNRLETLETIGWHDGIVLAIVSTNFAFDVELRKRKLLCCHLKKGIFPWDVRGLDEQTNTRTISGESYLR